jgi:hypothetical protein
MYYVVRCPAFSRKSISTTQPNTGRRTSSFETHESLRSFRSRGKVEGVWWVIVDETYHWQKRQQYRIDMLTASVCMHLLGHASGKWRHSIQLNLNTRES